MDILIWIGIIAVVFWIIYKIRKFDKSLRSPPIIDLNNNYIDLTNNQLEDFEEHFEEIPKESYIDNNGYERDSYDDRLIHRKVAFKHIYSFPEYPERFRDYDIHHKDRNKLNNQPENLQILTRKEHKEVHGF